MIGSINKNQLFNFKRKHDLKNKLLTGLSSASEELIVVINAWVELCDGWLDSINIGDELTQSDLALLVSGGIFTQPMRDELEQLATTEQTQSEFTEEVFPLPNNTSKTTYKLDFTTNPVNAAKVNIMARWGNDVNDLTPWETIRSFSNVRFKQGDEKGQAYTAEVYATSAPIRELKVVSDQTIGMTVTEL